MEIYNKKRWWKFLLVLGAATISLFSLFYTNELVGELKEEEQKKMELWAEANRQLISETVSDESLALVLEIIRNNTTVPVIVVDQQESIVFHRNVRLSKRNPDKDLVKALEKMKKNHTLFEVRLDKNEFQYIYYSNSLLLNRLRWFPVIQLFVVFVFMLIAYIAFNISRKWEQDQVWVGMARETAHQLGTPTTSLLGWLDVLELRDVDAQLIEEMRFDVKRLEIVTSRFSKIGSKPELVMENIEEVVSKMINYLNKRSSKLVNIQFSCKTLNTPEVLLSRSLFEWVIENLFKNAIDAMEGEGQIRILLHQTKANTIVEISDSGKGMSKAAQNTAFKPGFSTKKRGWGLGLSLSRRIIEQYHKGTISIVESLIGKGTTFRITLPSSTPSKN